MIEALIKDSLIRLSTATQPRGNYENTGNGQRENAFGGQPNATAQAEQITQEIDALDALLAEHRRALHPQLVHFLANRSYAKALTFLGGKTEGIPASAHRKINEGNT